MAGSVVDISKHPFSKTDQLLVDANVWLLLYGPQPPNSQRVAAYSSAFKRILQASSQIYIDPLITSEFVNTYARIHHRIMTDTNPVISKDFKTFRNSGAFAPIAQAIVAAFRRVLLLCKRVECDFVDSDVSAMLASFELGGHDLNDLLFVELCKHRDFFFITDDADFARYDVRMLTANRRVL